MGNYTETLRKASYGEMQSLEIGNKSIKQHQSTADAFRYQLSIVGNILYNKVRCIQ
jgi:hypothetical protein